MTQEIKDIFEKSLISKGYQKWVVAKHGEEDYDFIKNVRDGDDEKYMIIYKVWDFTKYDDSFGWAIDVVIMPNIDGRADLYLSSFSTQNTIMSIDTIERIARNYYQFITKELNNEN